jgi:hypothetical protein
LKSNRNSALRGGLNCNLDIPWAAVEAKRAFQGVWKPPHEHTLEAAEIRNLRRFGELDTLADKPMASFYDIPNIDHSEAAREQYEVGYRATVAELRQEGH